MFTIITDSSADITKKEATEKGIQCAYLPVTFEGMSYSPETDDDFGEFYRLLAKSKKLPTTSQPSVGAYLELFTAAKEKGDEVLVITISSCLSGTYNSAVMAKAMSEYENIHIVDSLHASLTQRMLVDYAVRMRDMGKTAAQAVGEIENIRGRAALFGLLDTLTYLKKGGRIPPSLAVVGNALGIKAAIALANGRIEPLGKARGVNNGKKCLWSEFEKDEIDREWPVYFGYARDKQAGEQFMLETVEKYNLKNARLFPIGSVIGTHAGPGAVEIAYVRKP